MKRKSLLAQIKNQLSKIPTYGWITLGLVLVVGTYSLIFFIPKSVTLSYAEKTCTGQLVLVPDVQKASSDAFSVAFENTLRIGPVALASTKVCFEPTQAPREGVSSVAIAPYGGVIGQKKFAVHVPASPVANVSVVSGTTISTARPLKIPLSSADALHQYSLRASDASASCSQADAELSCDVASLELSHGTEYTLSLHQSYKDETRMVGEAAVQTLQPLGLEGSSLNEGVVIYDMPTSFAFTFDRAVTGGEVKLEKITGETTELIPTSFGEEGAVLKVSFGELSREAQYHLTIVEAIGDNGSSLAGPIVRQFSTSGGPKVASVSVGAHSVARSAAIIVTLDQPLNETVDITKVARVEGLNGSVKKRSATELVYTISGGDCTAFALVLDKGVASGSNNEVSKEAWKFNSRTICGYSWTIGRSVQGRAIVAYSFGSGSKTILFTGGIHGSEPSSTTTMQAWVKHLQAYGDIIPADKRVVVVPNTNPDGIAMGSRYNANNVNLGRNFPTANWSASIETSSGVHSQGGGTAPGSEPEAAALISLTRQLRPRLEVSYHAQGRLVGANKFADSVSIGDTYAKTVGYTTMYYNAEDVMGYAMTGEYEDWMGESMNIPAILIELPSRSGNYLNSQLTALKKILAV